MPGGPGSVWSRTFRLLCSQPAPPYSTCGLSTADPPNEADPPNHLQWDQLPHCASLGALGRESRSTHKCHTGGQQGLPRASLAQVGLLPHTGCSDFSYLRNCTLKLRYRLPVRTHCEGPLDLARGALGKTEVHRRHDTAPETRAWKFQCRAPGLRAESSVTLLRPAVAFPEAAGSYFLNSTKVKCH